MQIASASGDEVSHAPYRDFTPESDPTRGLPSPQTPWATVLHVKIPGDDEDDDEIAYFTVR